MRALAKGVHDNGGYVINIGILPTNAVALLYAENGVQTSALTISASHNPPEYNGSEGV